MKSVPYKLCGTPGFIAEEMKQVEIFKTNVYEESEAVLILSILNKHYPGFNINFDMEDEDKILRIESINKDINGGEVELLLENIGIYCKTF